MNHIFYSHFDDHGIFLIDSDGKIYSAGRLFYQSSSSTDYVYNYNLAVCNSFGNKKCKLAYSSYESCVLLLEEDDGKYYVYGSGYNKYSLNLLSEDTYYVVNKKIDKISEVPMKNIVVSRSNFVGLSESNDIYTCGSQRDYYFAGDTKYYYEPKLWDWPRNNNYTPVDILKSSKDTIFIKLKNNSTLKEELFMYGQTFIFNKGTSNFVFYGNDPFKVDLNELITDFMTSNPSKDENNSENTKKNDENKIELEPEFDETIDLPEIDDLEEFIISRYELTKESHTGGSGSSSGTSNSSEHNNKEEFGPKVAKHLSENYIVKSIKVINDTTNSFKFAAVLGYEMNERVLDLNLLEEKYNSENLKDEKLKISEKNLICIINNKENTLKDLVYSKMNNFAYLNLKVVENSECYLLSPVLYKTQKELLEKTNFSNLEELKKGENSLENLISCSNSIEENYNLINNDLESSTFNYIKENFNEIINMLFLSEEILIYKNIKNSNYIEKKSELTENISLSIKALDLNINKIYPQVYEQEKSALIEKYFADLNSKILTDFHNTKIKHSTQDIKIPFKDYLLNTFVNSDRNLYFSDQTKFEFLEKIISIFEKCMLLILNCINLDENSVLSKIIIENINFVNKQTKDKLIQDEISKLSLNSDRKEIYLDRMIAKKFANTRTVDLKFEKTIFSQVYKEIKKFVLDDYYKNQNQLLFRVNLKGEGAIDAGGPAREIFTMLFEDLMSSRLDLFIPTPNQQTKSGLGRDLWTINPAARTVYHLDCFEHIGKIFGYSFLSKVYCPINLPNFLWKLILKVKLVAEDLEEIDVVAYNSIVKICLNPSLYPEELLSLFDYANFVACLSNGEEVELKENGRDIKVCEENYKEFISLYLEARFREIKEQAEAIGKGIK